MQSLSRPEQREVPVCADRPARTGTAVEMTTLRDHSSLFIILSIHIVFYTKNYHQDDNTNY